MTAAKLPLSHLSVRVPWHDTAYDGRICADPVANGACLRLLRISEQRDDKREVDLAGRMWAELALGPVLRIFHGRSSCWEGGSTA